MDWYTSAYLTIFYFMISSLIKADSADLIMIQKLIKTLEPKCANKSYTSDTDRALLPDPTYCIPPLLHSVSTTWSGFWWRRRICSSATCYVGFTSCYWFFYAPGGFSVFNEQNSWFSVNFSEYWPSLTPFSSSQPFGNIWELLSIWFYIMWCTSITWPVIA